MVWACFGQNGCKGYAIKTWILNAAVLAACAARGDMKVPESVEYWWLDEYVQRIELSAERIVTIHWKDGKNSSAFMKINTWQNDPFRTAQIYRNYLERLESGELTPKSSFTPEDRAELRRRAVQKEGDDQ
jgi:hypothetical protein